MKKILIIILWLINTEIWCDEQIIVRIENNNCTVVLYRIAEEFYCVEIRNDLYNTVIRTEQLGSRPVPRIYWLNDKLLRMDFGSALAPSLHSYFYSVDFNIISEDKGLTTGCIDLENNLILIAEFELTIHNIFSEVYIRIDTPNDSIGGILLFSISGNSHFENKNLILEYYDKNWELKTKIYDLSETILYRNG